MKLSEDAAPASNQLKYYADGVFCINDTLYEHSILLAETELHPWSPDTLSALSTTDWAPILEKQPGLLLLGTGPNGLFPEPALLAPLIEAKIPYEIMSTPAACRTFNLLIAEGRFVLAALIAG